VNIVAMLIVGLVVGLIAKVLMPGNDPGGLLVTTVLGIAGALLAGAIGRAAGWYTAGEGAGVIASIGGSVLLLVAYRALVKRTV
jgi:uncharacterized membrane protein YeaQ/YmgE (transglycosylase-associated protein family)